MHTVPLADRDRDRDWGQVVAAAARKTTSHCLSQRGKQPLHASRSHTPRGVKAARLVRRTLESGAAPVQIGLARRRFVAIEADQTVQLSVLFASRVKRKGDAALQLRTCAKARGHADSGSAAVVARAPTLASASRARPSSAALPLPPPSACGLHISRSPTASQSISGGRFPSRLRWQ